MQTSTLATSQNCGADSTPALLTFASKFSILNLLACGRGLTIFSGCKLLSGRGWRTIEVATAWAAESTSESSCGKAARSLPRDSSSIRPLQMLADDCEDRDRGREDGGGEGCQVADNEAAAAFIAQLLSISSSQEGPITAPLATSLVSIIAKRNHAKQARL